MGIKGLPKLIKDIAGNYASKSYKFSKFKRIKVAVDASLIIYQTVIALRSSGKDMTNEKGELTSHLHGLFYKILIFLQNEMVPVFVFDGKAPTIKNKTLEKRKLIQLEAEQHLTTLSDSEDEDYIKHFKQTFKPSKENIKECLILLDLMGIPYIMAPGEADVICSWLSARKDANGKRYVKGVCSDDSDMLPLGALYLFKDMLKFMSKDKNVNVISLNKALVKMNLTQDQFIDLSVLLGCDYCDNIKGIGPKTAYRLIQKYKTLENVIQFLKNQNKDSDADSDSETDIEDNDNTFDYQCLIDARNYFRDALKKIDQSKDFVLTDDNLQLRQYQFEELIDFMCVKHNFDVIRIQNGIKRLDAYYKKMNITRENTKQVYKILQPRSENYVFKDLSDTIEFLPSDEEEEFASKKTQPKKKILQLINDNFDTDSDVDYPLKKATNGLADLIFDISVADLIEADINSKIDTIDFD